MDNAASRTFYKIRLNIKVYFLLGLGIFIGVFSSTYFSRCEDNINYFMVIITFLIIAFTFLLELIKGSWDTFSPLTIFLLSFMLYYAFKPLSMLIEGEYFDKDIFTKAVIYINIGLIFFLIGFYSNIGTIIANTLKAFPNQWSKAKLKALSVIFILIGLATYSMLVKLSGLGFPGVFSNLTSFRIFVSSYGMAYFFYFVWLSFLTPMLLWLCELLSKPKLSSSELILFSCFVMVIILIFLSFGTRGIILGTVGSILICYHYLRKRINIIKLLPLIVILLIFMGIYANYRVATKIEAPLTTIYNIALQNAYLDFYYKMFMSRLNAFSTFLVILKDFPTENLDFLCGLGILNFFFRPIPRAIFPGKGYETGVLITKTFYPDVFESNIALAPSIFGEMYINLHLPGIIVGFFIFGIIVKTLQVYLKKHKGNKGVVLFYSLIAFISMGWLEAGFNSGASIIFFFVTFFVAFVFSIIKKNGKYV